MYIRNFIREVNRLDNASATIGLAIDAMIAHPIYTALGFAVLATIVTLVIKCLKSLR